MAGSPTGSPRWWQRHVHEDRRPFLMGRNRIVAAIRLHFGGLGFTEVDTAALQTSPGNETHLHGMTAQVHATDGRPAALYLHTSPEFACKKLMAAGETRLFTLARVFRDRERGPLHHPEFTMLEWYRADEPYDAIMADCADLLRLAAQAAGCTRVVFRGLEMDPFLPPERLTLVEAFARHAGIDLAATLGAVPDRNALAAAATAGGIRVAPDDTWSDVFSRVLVERIEPRLGIGCATILSDYPVSEAALARPCPADPRFAERFELYACGVELANAFGELTDAAEQRRRFEADMREKREIYGFDYPIDEEFLAALAFMPEASGAALGLDRLVMLAVGADRIDQVMWTPVVDPFA